VKNFPAGASRELRFSKYLTLWPYVLDSFSSSILVMVSGSSSLDRGAVFAGVVQGLCRSGGMIKTESPQELRNQG
jgi:hypothetical protein